MGYPAPNQYDPNIAAPSYSNNAVPKRGLPPGAGGGGGFANRGETVPPAAAAAAPATQAPVADTHAPAAPATAPAGAAAVASAAPADVTGPSSVTAVAEVARPETPEETYEEYPEDLVYHFGVFKKIRNCTSHLSEAVKAWANNSVLWEHTPSGKPQHMWSREGLFSDQSAKPASKVLKERTLAHQVRGILTRLAPEKYEGLRDELLALPIRQSSQEEINDVVQTMYSKAVNPADAIYVEWYIRLIVELVNHANLPSNDGKTNEVGKHIRKAILDRCQHEFERPFELKPEDKDENGNPLSDDERSKHMGDNVEAKARLKANVVFLGHLFVNKLVLEKVVQIALYQLLYGKSNGDGHPSKRHPQSYELEMFNALLRKVGPMLSAMTIDKFIKPFMDTIKQLSTNHKEKRIQFMMEDLYNYWKNGWTDPKKAVRAGPMRLDELNEHNMREQQRRTEEIERAAAAPRRVQPAAAGYTAPKKPEINIEELTSQFARDVADFEGTHDATGMADTLKRAKEHRATIMKPWLSRLIATVRLSEKREHISEILGAAVAKEALTTNDIYNLMRLIAIECVNERHFEDNPKWFATWASTVQKGAPYLTMDMHTMFLRTMITAEKRVRVDDMIQFVKEVVDVSGSSLLSIKPHESRRFRVLPAALLHSPALLPTDEDGEMLDEETDVDLIERLADAEEPETEVAFFYALFNGESSKDLVNRYQRNPHKCETGFVMKIVCGIFTYVRCDESMREADKALELLKTIIGRTQEKRENEQAILTEAFATWNELGRLPSASFFNFVRWLHANKLITAEVINKFKLDIIRSHGQVGKDVASALDTIR